MTKTRDLRKKWIKDTGYAREYDALGEEFAPVMAVAKARRRVDLS